MTILLGLNVVKFITGKISIFLCPGSFGVNSTLAVANSLGPTVPTLPKNQKQKMVKPMHFFILYIKNSHKCFDSVTNHGKKCFSQKTV